MTDADDYQLSIIEKLIFVKQEELSDQAFAELLGISYSLWKQITKGERSIGLTLLKSIARTFPDMDQDILKYLRER